MDIINKIEKEQLKQDVATFNVGDTVKVHCRVVEGGKERIQIFEGLVIARKGSSVNASFTVRKISYGEGVERVFPLYSPNIESATCEANDRPPSAAVVAAAASIASVTPSTIYTIPYTSNVFKVRLYPVDNAPFDITSPS
jgi:ribosomal protein L19